MRDLYSQIYLIEVVCGIHRRNQRTQMLVRIFEFVDERGPLRWCAFYVINFNPIVCAAAFKRISNVWFWPNPAVRSNIAGCQVEKPWAAATGRHRPRADGQGLLVVSWKICR
jgi:hypothetical protein